MRIIAGTLKGHRIEVPARGVRPTLDRVRESVFGMLGAVMVGADVLDLYAGSGALGLEALSRGAGSVRWVESDRKTFKILKGNVEKLTKSLPETRIELRCGDALRYAEREDIGRFDLIFADPPYDKKGRGQNLSRLLEVLQRSRKLKPDGLLAYELATSEEFEIPSQWQLVREKSWGATRVLFLREPADSTPHADAVPAGSSGS